MSVNGQTQTLQQAFVPLVGGAEAVYTPSGLAWYRHPDWLGSSRLASTPSRSVYYDGAYAPYGESYAESGTPDHSSTGQNQDVAPTGQYPLYDFFGGWRPDESGRSAKLIEVKMARCRGRPGITVKTSFTF
jgi:hypothetical protein